MDSGLELHFPLPKVSLGTSENAVNTASKYKAIFSKCNSDYIT